MILIIDIHQKTPFAVWKHLSGFDSYNASAKLSFEKPEHSEYFIKHFNGQHDYKEAMPEDEEVLFSVYHEGMNGEFEDKMIKPVGWKPFKLS